VKDLSGATALLTGASSGLGPHIARRLHRDGVRFILSARREEELKKLAAELDGARVIVADLSRRGGAEELAEEAGEVDLLIANAGVPASGRLVGFAPEREIDTALVVNLRSAIMLARLLLPGMLARGRGHLVFMSSLAGKVAQANSSLYAATKFGLRGFGLALHEELKGTGVGASVICPTYVRESGMWAEAGLKAPAAAGEVSPVQVAEAVQRAIREDLAEVDVAPLRARVGVRLAAAAPRLARAVTRRSGAAEFSEEAVDRQKHKR